MRSVWRRVVVTYASSGPGPSVQNIILTGTDRLTSVLGPPLPSGWAVSRSHSRSTSAMVGGRVSVPSTSIWPTSQKNLMYAAFLKRTVPADNLRHPGPGPGPANQTRIGQHCESLYDVMGPGDCHWQGPGSRWDCDGAVFLCTLQRSTAKTVTNSSKSPSPQGHRAQPYRCSSLSPEHPSGV